MQKQEFIETLRELTEYDCEKDECCCCPLCIFDSCIKGEIRLRLNELKVVD